MKTRKTGIAQRGFAAMPVEKQRKIASMGGTACSAKYDMRERGRIGGTITQKRRREKQQLNLNYHA